MVSRPSVARAYPDPDEFDASRKEEKPRASKASVTSPNSTQKIYSLTALIVVPSLDVGAADIGVVELVRILSTAGHRPIVLSRGGRLESAVMAAGAEFIRADMASKNPVVLLRNAAMITRLIRTRRCDIVHAHGRAPAWSAYLAARITRVPFVTSWYKGFREQNIFKRLYNGVMARGDRVIAVSDQIAELINERYATPWARITVVPTSVDADRFDPAGVSLERIEAMRHAWGAGRETKIILVAGRLIRRKGHHLIVRAIERLRQRGLKDFICVFTGENSHRTHYAGELWDLVLATNTADVVRLAGPADDLPAAYAAAAVVVSAATQPEGLQHAILEAQAMARPVIVSDLGAGPEVVLAPPAVSEDRMTGLRFSAGDDSALAATLIRVFSMPDPARRAMGMRGRQWVLGHFNAPAVADLTLRLYADVAMRRLPA